MIYLTPGCAGRRVIYTNPLTGSVANCVIHSWDGERVRIFRESDKRRNVHTRVANLEWAERNPEWGDD